MRALIGAYITIGAIYAAFMYGFGNIEYVINKVDSEDDYMFFNNMSYTNKCILLITLCIITWPVRIFNLLKRIFRKRG